MDAEQKGNTPGELLNLWTVWESELPDEGGMTCIPAATAEAAMVVYRSRTGEKGTDTELDARPSTTEELEAYLLADDQLDRNSPTWIFVLAGAVNQEKRLAQYRYRGDRPGWFNAQSFGLYVAADQNLSRGYALVVHPDGPGSVRTNLADARNFAMMLEDQAGELLPDDWRVSRAPAAVRERNKHPPSPGPDEHAARAYNILNTLLERMTDGRVSMTQDQLAENARAIRKFLTEAGKLEE